MSVLKHPTAILMRFCLVRYEFGFDDGRGWGLFISRRNICFILRRNTHKSLKAPGLSILRFSTKEGPPVFRRLHCREVTPPPACQVSQNKPSALRRKRFLGRRAPKRPEGFAPKRTEGGSEGFAPKRPKAGPSVAELPRGRRAGPSKGSAPRGRRAGPSEGSAPKRSESRSVAAPPRGRRGPVGGSRSQEVGGRSVAALPRGRRAVGRRVPQRPKSGRSPRSSKAKERSLSKRPEDRPEGFAPKRSKATRRALLPRGRKAVGCRAPQRPVGGFCSPEAGENT